MHHNDKLQQQKKRLLSVPGIGEVTSLYLLLATKGFFKLHKLEGIRLLLWNCTF